jgi:replicative DNA helicase
MATQPSLRTGETPRKDSGNGPGRGRPGGNGGRVFPTSPTGSAQDIHRAPPHSVEAEQGVLGSMLISPREAIAEVVEKINEEYFYVPAHQTIYQALVDLWNAGQAIDLITFTQVLRDRNLLETVGGAALVTSLFTFVPTAANLGYYLEIVRDKYILRSIITASTESVRRAYEEQDEVGNLLDEVEQRIFAVGEDRFKGQMLSMKDQVMGAIESIEKLYENHGGITGISTGFTELDRMTDGMHPAEMIVIAARPSMGKTALAMNIAEHVAINERLPVGVFSLEMSSQQLVQRMLCSRARVNLQKVRGGFLAERDFPSLTTAASKLAEAKIFIDDSAGLSILEMRAKARRLKAQQDVQLIVIDYLQLLRSTSRRAQENRQLEISEISAGLKALAKELKIPLIVVAQLNRQPEARSRGEPRLSDLRESGSIEQDADLVGLLLRPDLYKDDEKSDDDKDDQGEEKLHNEKGEEAELIIAKQRNGPIGKIDLTFLKHFTRFENRARNVTEPEEAF